MAPINFSIMNANTKLYQCEKRKNHREKKRWSFVRFSRELEGEIRVVERPSVHLDSPHHPNTSSASQCALQLLPSSPINSHIHTLMTEVGCHAMCRPPRQRRQCPIFNAQPLMQPLAAEIRKFPEDMQPELELQTPTLWLELPPESQPRQIRISASRLDGLPKSVTVMFRKQKTETTTKQSRKI